MKVSLITIALNNADTIADTLNSVADQTYPDIEHIVVDGASADGTMDVVAAHGSRVAKTLCEPDKGLFDALEKGYRLATGDVIGHLHADDVFAGQDTVEDVVRGFQESGADVLWGDVDYVDRDDPDRVLRYWKAGSFSVFRAQFGWHPPHTAFYARRSTYLDAGLLQEGSSLFRERYALSGDYELTMRLLVQRRCSWTYLDRLLVRMRTGGVSDRSLKNLRGIFEMNRLCYAAWRDIGGRAPILIPFCKPVRKVLQGLG